MLAWLNPACGLRCGDERGEDTEYGRPGVLAFAGTWGRGAPPRMQRGLKPSLHIPAAYGIQFDNTVNVWSGWAGSLVGRCTRKSCWPPMSPCIMNCIESVVRFPGLRVIEPMTGSGGQHPSTTST